MGTDWGEVGRRIEAERTRQGMSRERLAALAGVSAGTVFGIETGQRPKPQLRTIAPMWAALGLPEHELAALTGRPVPTREQTADAVEASIQNDPTMTREQKAELLGYLRALRASGHEKVKSRREA